MKYYKSQIMMCTALLALLGSCQHSGVQTAAAQKSDDLSSCIRTVMKLDEGRWAYMGTIARLDGSFRTYEAISVHSSAGEDMWSAKAFDGDVGGDEASAELGYVKLVGNSVVPINIETGELDENGAVDYKSCAGPDIEGRYEVQTEYKLPNGDGTFDIAKNVTWYSEHGSYYAEDNINDSGRVVSRRSGVNTPADK